ncbi:unnamed protein product [Urochloa decumbens]|uniref:Protein kinase domain-containing protein n=1 Tax=Urochloa decumbens TaxID=240449 RepID=A0ABC8YG00_9POAL
MGNACCARSAAAVASYPPLGVPDWTEAGVPLFREGVPDHPNVTERYAFEGLLGTGGSGAVVWIAASKSTTSATTTKRRRRRRLRVACKTIYWNSLRRTEEVEDLRRELTVMASLPRHHPAMVRLHEVYEDEAAVHLVMDLCGRGSLADRMVERRWFEWCTEDRAARVAWELVEAVRALHEAGIMHRDLKPENLMFSGRRAEQQQLKVIDFGFATSFGPGEIFRDEVGSFPYMAPEVFLRSYGPAADVWSAGIIVYLILCGRHPFPAPDDTYMGQRKATLRGGAADVESHPWPLISGAAKSLVLAMLEPDPTRRPTAHQLLGTLTCVQRFWKVFQYPVVSCVACIIFSSSQTLPFCLSDRASVAEDGGDRLRGTCFTWACLIFIDVRYKEGGYTDLWWY